MKKLDMNSLLNFDLSQEYVQNVKSKRNIVHMNSFWKEIRKIKKNHLFIMYSNSLAEDGYYCRAYNIFMFVCRKWKYFLSLNMNNHLENSVGGNAYSWFFFMQQIFNFSVHSKTISFLKCDIFTYSDIGEKCVLRFTPIFFCHKWT